MDAWHSIPMQLHFSDLKALPIRFDWIIIINIHHTMVYVPRACLAADGARPYTNSPLGTYVPYETALFILLNSVFLISISKLDTSLI